jgi:hypothetical protein
LNPQDDTLFHLVEELAVAKESGIDLNAPGGVEHSQSAMIRAAFSIKQEMSLTKVLKVLA